MIDPCYVKANEKRLMEQKEEVVLASGPVIKEKSDAV
jgi:hypothetical protein